MALAFPQTLGGGSAVGVGFGFGVGDPFLCEREEG